ncbi:MAG: hypothetical protein QM598_08190 [Protaetiibacter sp.]
MTAVTATTHPLTAPGARVWRIVRLLTANPVTTVGMPVLVLSLIFAGTWFIWWMITASLSGQDATDAADGIRYNGATAWIFFYMLVVAVQAVNLAFPLALGYGSTRRAFSLGASLTFLMLSAGYALLMTVGRWVEVLTNGWGINGSFFGTFYFDTDAGWIAQWWVYFCWFVFFFFTGMIFAAVFVRWRALGLTTSLLVLGVLVIGAIALITFTSNWNPVWERIAELGTLGVASWLLVPAVLAAGIGHLLLRRATPRG